MFWRARVFATSALLLPIPAGRAKLVTGQNLLRASWLSSCCPGPPWRGAPGVFRCRRATEGRQILKVLLGRFRPILGAFGLKLPEVDQHVVVSA